jgi:hypothetical protein
MAPSPVALPTPRITQALVQATLQTQQVAHNARNEFAKFDYTTSEAIFQAVRHPLAESGLSVRRSGYTVEWGERGDDGAMVDGVLWSVFELSHIDGEVRVDRAPWPFEVGKGRPIDRALAGALTSSFAYWLRDLLMLPRSSQEDEIAARDDEPYERPTRAATPRERDRQEQDRERDAAQRQVRQNERVTFSGRKLDEHFVADISGQLGDLGMSWADVRAGLVNNQTVSADVVAGPPATWPVELEGLLKRGIESRLRMKANQASGKVAAPRAEDVGSAKSEEPRAATRRVYHEWPRSKTITPVDAVYWQDKLLASARAYADQALPDSSPDEQLRVAHEMVWAIETQHRVPSPADVATKKARAQEAVKGYRDLIEIASGDRGWKPFFESVHGSI